MSVGFFSFFVNLFFHSNYNYQTLETSLFFLKFFIIKIHILNYDQKVNCLLEALVGQQILYYDNIWQNVDIFSTEK